MLTPPPALPPLKGLKALGDWLNLLRDYTVGLQPVYGRNLFTARTAVGITNRANAAGDDAQAVKQYRLKDWNADDYLICRTFDGTTEGSEDIYIAKSYYLRAGVFDGVTIDLDVEYLDETDTLQSEVQSVSYEYKSATFRVATNVTDPEDTFTEEEVVLPRFSEDDLIYAIESDELQVTRNLGTEEDPQNVALTLMDLNVDGRAWYRFRR